MPQFRIDSLADPRLDPYRSLKKTNVNRYQEAFIAEGVTVVDRLLQSNFNVLSVLMTESKAESFQSKVPAGVPIYRLTRELASQLVGYNFHMGLLAAGRRPAAVPFESVTPARGPSLVFVADRIIDPQNMGLLVRIAAGFGADALLITPGSADPLSRRAIRVSTGNVFSLPVIKCPNGSHAIQNLKQLKYTCCATVLSDQATELSSYPFPGRTAIVFGNESHGVSNSIIAGCDRRLSVSMLNGTDSLNVAMAAGIFAYAYRVINPDIARSPSREAP